MSPILIYILVIIIAVLIVILLPATSNIGHLGLQKPKRKEQYQNHNSEDTQTYVSPDEELDNERKRAEKENFTAKLKNLTKDDMPFRFKMDNETSLRKRGTKKMDQVSNNDENEYDYDIDELIKEEREQELQEYLENEALKQKESV